MMPSDRSAERGKVAVGGQILQGLQPNEVVSGGGEAALLRSVVDHDGVAVKRFDPVDLDPADPFRAAAIHDIAGRHLRRTDLNDRHLTSHDNSSSTARTFHLTSRMVVGQSPARKVPLADSVWSFSQAYGRAMPETAETFVDAIRDLIGVVRTADLSDTDLGWATTMIHDIADRLRPSMVKGVRMQHTLRFEDYASERGLIDPDSIDDRAAASELDPVEFFPYSPVIGRLNPISAPVRMWRAVGDSNGEVHGEAVFGSAFNGPPESVHGGIIAATFDELLGATAVVNGLGAFTGTLSVVYRSPTPLDQLVEMRGWVSGSERRKVFLEGELTHEGTVCATASGIFIRSENLIRIIGGN